MKRGKNLLWRLGAAFALSCFLLAPVCVSAGEAVGSASEGGVTVTITTDKEEYNAKEEVHYSITIENNRAHYKVDKATFQYSNTEGLVSADGGELPNAFAILEEGASQTITGVLVGTEDKYPAVSEDTDHGNSQGKTEDTATAGDEAGTGSGVWVVAVIAAAAVILIAAFLLIKKKTGKGARSLFLLLMAVSMVAAKVQTAAPVETKAADYEKVTLRPYVNFTYAGQKVMIRIVVELHLYQKYLPVSSSLLDNPKKITCHDPSVFRDFDGTYYILGTHMTGGYTKDLRNWTSIDKAYQASFTKEVKDQIRAWNEDDRAGSWFGYLWAPDIIYNPVLNKYCMYLSANGDNWKSNIVLLTADHVDGPYDYVGTIVYGGFSEETYEQTDAPFVTGEEVIPERYVTYGVKNKKWGDMYPNCIDPCVFYDDEGKLWMSYGSWSGGIFMLELDEETGLRDYNVTYETNLHSDAYFGRKIAGGAYVSGEASYIQKVGKYYYLFISYGNLEAAGGYNVRVFRSEKPDGDYVDALGNSAFYDKYRFNYNESVGVRLFGGYKWRTFTNGQVAQGHNSAFVDEDGKAYMVFHTRTNNGTEAHVVKVHQMFVNKNGWLVAAPYQTSGETLKQSGYSVEEVAGEYDIILHELDIDYKNLEVKKSKCAFLNTDGTITGEYEGTWKLEPGTPYIVLMIDGIRYSGVTLEMNVENTKVSTMVFTALGESNQITIWGSKCIE